MGSHDRCASARRHIVARLIPALALAVIAFFAGGERSARAENRCVDCHSGLAEPRLNEPAKKFRASVHRDDAVGCAGCHGGDPEDPTVRAHSPAAGFTAHPAHDKIPSICGGCHGDARFIRRINASLPIDQLTLFGLSRHGERAASGDGGGPVCNTCHGTHDVVRVADASSPVHPHNVAELCGSCHANTAHMAPYNLPTDQLAKWKRSVHGQAVQHGNERAPSCTGCHGSHGEMRAAVSSVGRTCGTCHVEEARRFKESPHAKPFGKRGLAECVVCHGAHDVPSAGPLLLGFGPDGTCGKCHSGDEGKPLEVIRLLAERLGAAKDRAAHARSEVDRAAGLGLYVPDAAARLDELAKAEARLRPFVHAIDPAALEAPIADVASAAEGAEHVVADAEQTRRMARRGYVIAVAVVLVMFVGLLIAAVRLARKRGAA